MVNVPRHAAPIDMIDDVIHSFDFLLQDRQAELDKMTRRNHRGKIAAWHMEFAERGQPDPAPRGQICRFENAIEVIEDRVEIRIGDIDQLPRLFRGVDQVQAKTLDAAPCHRAIFAGVQIGVADQELAFALLNRTVHQRFDAGEVLVVHVELELRHVVPGVNNRVRPRGDLAIGQFRAIKRSVDIRPQVRIKHGEGFAVKTLALNRLDILIHPTLEFKPALFLFFRGAFAFRGTEIERGIVRDKPYRRTIQDFAVVPRVDALHRRFKIRLAFQFDVPPICVCHGVIVRCCTKTKCGAVL